MTRHPIPSSDIDAAGLRALQLALLVLGDETAAVVALRDTLRVMATKYALDIKETASPLFQRLLLRQVRRARWRQRLNALLPDLLAAIVPPRIETMAPGTLETLQLEHGDGRPAWQAQASGGRLVQESLRLLPARQRTAFWLLHVESLPLRQAAQALARTRRGVRRDGARAVAMLTAILALKGCPVAGMAPEAVARDAAMALKNLRPGLASAWATARHDPAAPARHNAAVTWRRLALGHPLGTRLSLLATLTAALLLGLSFAWPRADQAQTRADVQLLAGDVPLSVLLDPRFDEAAND